ncbi:hypothetical protein HOLleu_01421 [Holothuria leucospilota]|uniref:Endonuclease/exonuclease/phosphatase domain-containing protein n=1 Tax=Holothuria leucospilota TaxID=206669 RepID=A0A9Q1HKX7_HOLLE|nr:hypothetical protein HOLleu_01421 [Holothuria leucospilota]
MVSYSADELRAIGQTTLLNSANRSWLSSLIAVIPKEMRPCKRGKPGEELCQAIDDIESSSPDVLIVMNGDFNHCCLERSPVYYHQYVSCPTRSEATLDLFFSNVKAAYNSSQLPYPGDSDHHLVLISLRPIIWFGDKSHGSVQ